MARRRSETAHERVRSPRHRFPYRPTSPRRASNRCGRLRPTSSWSPFRTPGDGRPWVIVFDDEGVPRWWYNPDTRALWGQVTADGDLVWARSFGDGYGLDPRMAHEVRSESGQLLHLVSTKGSIVDGHEYRELPQRQRSARHLRPRNRRPAPLRWPEAGGDRLCRSPGSRPRGQGPLALELAWPHRPAGDRPLVAERAQQPSPPSAPRDLRPRPHQLDRAPRRGGSGDLHPPHRRRLRDRPRERGDQLEAGRDSRPANRCGSAATRRPSCSAASTTRASTRRGRLTIFDNGKDRPRRPRVVFYRLDLEAGEGRLPRPAQRPRGGAQPLLRLGPGN